MSDRWVCRSCWASNEAGWNRCVGCRTTRGAENPAEGPLSGDEPRSLWRMVPGGFRGIVGLIFVVSSVVGWGSAVDRDADGTVVGSGTLHIQEVRVGDCFDLAEDQDPNDVGDVLVMPCDGPHEYEAYHASALADAPLYPSEVTMLQLVESKCRPAFEQYVGRDYETSRFEASWFGPTKLGWADGDRSVLCALTRLSGAAPMVGSARGSGR